MPSDTCQWCGRQMVRAHGDRDGIGCPNCDNPEGHPTPPLTHHDPTEHRGE